jgi:hypothetical protein
VERGPGRTVRATTAGSAALRRLLGITATDLELARR